MNQTLLASLAALALSGCVTVNGRPLMSMFTGKRAASAPGAAAPAPTARSGADAMRFLEATPPLVLDVDSAVNPYLSPVFKPGPRVESHSVQVGCGNAYQVQPVTRFEVKARSTWSFETDAELVVRRPDGTCDHPSGDWAPGVYALFAIANAEKDQRAELTLTIANLERRLVVGDAPQLAAGADLPFAFELEATARGGHRKTLCGATSHQPAAVVTLAKPMTGALRLLSAPEGGHFVALPLSEAPLSAACEQAKSDQLPAGRFALYLTAPTPGAKGWAAVEPRAKNSSTWDEEWKVALKPLREVPEVVPLKERAFSRWYPWYRVRAPEPLFLTAPRALFVSVSADSAPVSVGEPLLLVKYGDEHSTVLRATGDEVSVRTERLAELPPEVKLPHFTELAASDNRFESWDRLASPQLKPRLQEWRAQQYKHSDCIDAYMREKDPSWGKQNYVIIVSQREAHLAAAHKRCKSDALDAAWLKLKEDVLADRKALRAKLVSTLPAKLK